MAAGFLTTQATNDRMAPKGGNAKKESGRAKKAENGVKKSQAANAERVRPR